MRETLPVCPVGHLFDEEAHQHEKIERVVVAAQQDDGPSLGQLRTQILQEAARNLGVLALLRVG